MESEVKQILDMASNSHAHPKPFVCKDCQNTGYLEVVEYYGKQVMPGFPKPMETVLGFNLFYKMVYIYYQTKIPGLPRYDQFDITPENIKLMEKVQEIYNPLMYYRVKEYEICNQCKSHEFKRMQR